MNPRRIILVVLGGIVAFILIILILIGRNDIPVERLSEKYAKPPSEFIPINGMDVHFRNEGNREDSLPLVLLHGTGASLHTFDPWVEQLSRTRRVIRMDLPGFGLTGPFPDRNYTMDAYVDFIDKLLEKLKIDSCIIGGNSFGGQVSWNYTLQHPNRVKKLILIDASGYPQPEISTPIAFKLARIPVANKILTYVTPRSMVRSSVEDVYADKTRVTEQLVDRYMELTLREGNRQGLVDRMLMKVDTTTYHQIRNIRQPTLILWGGQDLLIPVASAHRFENDLENDTLVIMENAGHVPMEELPNESLIPVLSFINR